MVFPEVKLDDLIPFMLHAPFGQIVRCCSCYVGKYRSGYFVKPSSGKPFVCHFYYDLYYQVALWDSFNFLFHPDLFLGEK